MEKLPPISRLPFVFLGGCHATVDPDDSIIRLAPTFVEADKLQKAIEVFSAAVQIAHFDIEI